MRDHAPMSSPLLSRRRIAEPPRDFLDSVGSIFATFGPPAQDSGNLSYGIQTPAGRFFVKTTDPEAAVLLSYEERIELLRNAAGLAARCPHPAMPELKNVLESPAGPLLVYEWVEGELLRRDPGNPASAHEKFRALPVADIVAALDVVFELHAMLAETGFVAADFYDGCLIYDFAAKRIQVMDLDGYHIGPFTNRMGRLFGSSRFMAPEEFELGAVIDERTTVFNLGRAAAVFLGDGAGNGDAFRGGERRYSVMAKACAPDPDDRYRTVGRFFEAWKAGR